MTTLLTREEAKNQVTFQHRCGLGNVAVVVDGEGDAWLEVPAGYLRLGNYQDLQSPDLMDLVRAGKFKELGNYTVNVNHDHYVAHPEDVERLMVILDYLNGYIGTAQTAEILPQETKRVYETLKGQGEIVQTLGLCPGLDRTAMLFKGANIQNQFLEFCTNIGKLPARIDPLHLLRVSGYQSRWQQVTREQRALWVKIDSDKFDEHFMYAVGALCSEGELSARDCESVSGEEPVAEGTWVWLPVDVALRAAGMGALVIEGLQLLKNGPTYVADIFGPNTALEALVSLGIVERDVRLAHTTTHHLALPMKRNK